MNTSSGISRLKIVLSLFLGVMIIMGLSGCGKEKYKLSFDGYGFESKKTEYYEGETVTVYYDLVATDTDYSFSLDCDDVKLKQEWDNNHGYIFKFTMPAHDVKISVSSRNSMEYDPGVNDPDISPVTVNSDNDLQTETWFCPECGTKNDMLYCSGCGLKKSE